MRDIVISKTGIWNRPRWLIGGSLIAVAAATTVAMIPNLFRYADPTGLVATFNSAGIIDDSANNPFFQSLGTNGRTCGTCHLPSDAMGLSATSIQGKFANSHGSDPLFAPVDGANCPSNTSNDPSAHSLLLNNGLIRIALAVPASAQFQIKASSDPYGCALVTDPTTGVQTVSVYRRPLPTTNLRYLSAVMFDGRETLKPLTTAASFQGNLAADLMQQSIDATMIHAQANAAPSLALQTTIVNFELGLSSAQTIAYGAGTLDVAGAQGGPANLSGQGYYPGVNDSLGADPQGHPFNSTGMTMYSAWETQQNPLRSKIAAGEKLFNTRPLTISNVRGLTDNKALAAALGTTVPIAPFQGFCTTCHDTPNVGNHSLPLALDIGTGHDPSIESDPLIANGVSQLSFPELPIFEITGCPNPFADPTPPAAPYTIYTTDPGKGLVTGLCSDVGRTKGPILRGLAARAPYFHNGAGRDLSEVLDFYNQRFQMNLTATEKDQLIAFLNSL